MERFFPVKRAVKTATVQEMVAAIMYLRFTDTQSSRAVGGLYPNGLYPPPPLGFQCPSVFLCLLPSVKICTTTLNVQVSCCDDQGRLV